MHLIPRIGKLEGIRENMQSNSFLLLIRKQTLKRLNSKTKGTEQGGNLPPEDVTPGPGTSVLSIHVLSNEPRSVSPGDVGWAAPGMRAWKILILLQAYHGKQKCLQVTQLIRCHLFFQGRATAVVHYSHLYTTHLECLPQYIGPLPPHHIGWDLQSWLFLKAALGRVS